jgi:hypothetical protein
MDVSNYSMSTKNKVATTVKVENALYDGFKVLGIRYKLTLQGLVEKTVYRYVNEEIFRDNMNSFIVPTFSSSYVSTPATASIA